MSKQYDPKVLRKLQLAQCIIMEDFIKICEENNLDYFIFAGCAIGVERHGGFIPWDDDIDIGMLRADYEKFKEIALKDYADKYEILEISQDAKFPFLNMEFKRKGTRNVPEIFKDCDVDMGIDVAIYPFDNVADDKSKRKRQLRAVFFWHKIKILREFGHPVLFIKGWKRTIVSLICVVLHAVLKVFNISHAFINKQYLKSALKFNNTETEWVSCFFGTTPMENSMKRTEIFPLAEKKFEYLTVKIPGKNHECLTRKFGDYMQIPPPEKQKNHVPYILDFGPFEDLQINE
ncbi:MAG: LicD family protein [Ruminococcaceae bacterium]|nr:LicD family protein [Oscillospiraceae bacterium]